MKGKGARHLLANYKKTPATKREKEKNSSSNTIKKAST